MSNCGLFNIPIFDSLKDETQLTIDTAWLKNLIPAYNKDRSGVWFPVFIKHDNSLSEYGNILSNPQNINDTQVAPCNCASLGPRVARNTVIAFNDFSEENEGGTYCDYCQKLQQSNMNCVVDVKYQPKGDVGDPGIIQWPIVSLTPNPIGGATNYSVSCCSGGCDTRMLTDDVSPKIPYLNNSYITKFFDFKYLQQFPSIENPGLGHERFVSYNGSFKNLSLNNTFFYIDWILKPRIGEIEPLEDTYHSNVYNHKKSYSRYLLNNKTCGNFILQTLNAPTQISAWQTGNMPLLSGLNLELPVTGLLGPSGLQALIPSINDFTIPYGITDDTHYNIFLKQPSSKVGSFWKWNFTSGVLCWYRYYDKDRENDNRVIPGVDLYISDGDVFFAKNDGPEPLAGNIPVSTENCKHKICPSGLKFSDYQTQNASGTITIVPSGSEFIYISQNIYSKFYNLVDKLIKVYRVSNNINDQNILYKEIINKAAILASGPEYADITINLFNYPSGYSDADKSLFIKTIKSITNQDIKLSEITNWFNNNLDSNRDEYKRLINLNKKLCDKDMPSYNGLNMIKSTGDLVQTLAQKYGAYLWIPPDTDGQITINKPIYSHAYLDIDFEPYIKLQDTKFLINNSNNSFRSCSSSIKGSTKIFGYDQYFEIGDSKLKATILDNNLVYNSVCEGSPPVNRITDVASTMSVYFNDKTIYTRAYGSYQTSFSDIYSRFPSVSSTLDTTFTDLPEEQDGWGDIGVFSLINDSQLRLNRTYNGFAAHPNIDLVGFHEDGGCYYESTLLNKDNGTGTVAFIKDWKPKKSKNNIVIKFKTYDVGIKLYSIGAQKLRNTDNLSCKTFPLDQSCNCWGINRVANYPFKCSDSIIYETPDLFTPYLSTQNIPLIAYGGYDEKTINSYLGDFRIPNHPDITAKLPTVNYTADPNNIYGCKNTASITLPNYISSKWQIKIPSFDTDNATIWVSYQDSFSFYTDRTQNKIKINNEEIFPNEQKILNATSNIFDIEIYNQFLSNIFDNPNQYIYNKDAYSCSVDKTENPYDTTPKYLKPSTITIYFTRIPKNNILSFKMPGLQSLGNLKKSFFEPNSGLRSAEDGSRGSSLHLNKFNGLFNFDYGYKLFNNTSNYNAISPLDVSYSGSIKIENLSKIIQFINLKKDTKKLKLYIKVNDDNQWYEYEDHKTFGYYNIQENIQYHSWPTFFAETYLQTDQALGPFIPAIPKVPLEHIYCDNRQSWYNLIAEGEAEYPYFNFKFNRGMYSGTGILNNNRKKYLWIKGSRPYFMLSDIDSIKNTGLHYLNEDNILYPIDIKPYEEFIFDSTGNLVSSYKTFAIKEILFPTNTYSLSDKDIIDQKSIALSENNRQLGVEEEPINTFSFLKPNKILAKYLIAYPNVSSGNKVSSIIDIPNTLYTVLEMEQDHPYANGYLFIDKISHKFNNLSVFPTTKAFNINFESNNLVKFNEFQIITSTKNLVLDKQTGEFIETITSNTGNENFGSFSNKWSDLIYYNNTTDTLNNQIYYKSIDDVYGPFLYDNIFNYILANNFYYSYQIPTDSGTVDHKFPLSLYIKNSGSTGVVNIDSPSLTHYIHQPFSLGRPEDKYQPSANKFNLFKNQNPIVDINIYEHDSESTAFKRSNILEYNNKGLGLSGILCISGIYRPRYTEPKYTNPTGFDFFVNLNNSFNLKPIAFTSDGFYSRSFVVSETYNILDGLSLNTKIDANAATSCDSIILPNISIPPLALNNSVFNWSNFSKILSTGAPYISYPVFCSIDTIGECGDSKNCSVSPVGSVSVSSKFKTYSYKYKNINDILKDKNTIDYAISVDAGLYCPLRPSGDIPYIVRSEIDGYSPMFSTNSLNGTSQCIDGKSYPPLERNLSVWDDLYQYEISSNLVDPLNIDIWANEILFRSIHGSKQNINLNNISKNSSNNNITYQNILERLINNPENNISIIYDNIPYDYDTSTAGKLKINGAIRIYGAVAVGDSIKITYNGQVYNINVKEDGNDIYAECVELNAKGLLLEKTVENKSIYIREKGTNSSQPGASERVIGECKSPFNFSVSTTCADPSKGTYLGPSGITDKYAGAIELAGPYTLTTSTYFEGSPGTICYPKPHKETIVVPDTYNSFPSIITNNTTCSAFPYEQSKINILSPLDSFFDKHIASKFILGSTSSNPSILECAGYGIDTCSTKTNCCNNETKVIKTISYRIKDCHYDFTMKGLLTKSINNIAQLTVENQIIPPCSTSYSDAKKIIDSVFDIIRPQLDCPCDCNNPSNGYRKDFYSCGDLAFPGGGGLGQLEGCCTELCLGTYGTCKEANNLVQTNTLTCSESYLLLVETPAQTVYEVVESTTTSTNNITLKAACARTLCTFIYDNNQVKLYLGSSKTTNGIETYNGGNCLSLTTNNCPSIKVELPNNTYGIDDTNSSSCTECSTENNAIDITANPNWEFAVDTLYCLLDSIVVGGAFHPGNSAIELLCRDLDGSGGPNGDSFLYGFDRPRTCGKPPDRNCTSWHHFASNPILGSDSKPGSKCDENIVVSNGYHIDIPLWTTNSVAVAKYTELWKQKMEEIYTNKHYCTNSYDYKEEELIEGVIPGSCSLEFATVSWPILGVQTCANVDGCGISAATETQDGNISIMIAYIKYRYKHPINLTDKIIDEFSDEVTSDNCRNYFGVGGFSSGCRTKYFGNMKEEIKSREKRNSNCVSSPQCYDRNRPCDPSNVCCNIDQYGNTYRK